MIPHTKTTLEENQQQLSLVTIHDDHDKVPITVCALDWVHCERDIQVSLSRNNKDSSFDTIVSTDVLFAPQLVEPLLDTASRLWKNETTVWYLCVQIRCAKSHQLFLDRCPHYGFHLDDWSSRLNVMGQSMECCLFRITRRRNSDTTTTRPSSGGSQNNKKKQKTTRA